MHMNFRKGVIFAAAISVLGAGGIRAEAADIPAQTGNISIGADVLLKQIQETEREKSTIIIEETDTKEEFTVREQNGKYDNTCFVNIPSDYIYVRSAASDESDWTGKLYPGNAVILQGPIGEWTAVQSGNISGFIRSEYLMNMENAQQKIRQMEIQALQNKTEVTFSYGETKQEEAERLQAEAEQRAREEEERKQAQRQSVVDYACQFIGNPYVWGGTSLTNGADCSGFVQSVYAHFGVSLPRTSASQRGAGYEVSYSEAQPGDIICYSGHVGIYVGDGKIVNAQDPAHGIGISSATYTSILTVRRIF